MNKFVLIGTLAACLGALTGCEEETKLVVTSCLGDADCPEGQLCDQGTCVSMSKFRCDAVTTGASVLQPAPHVVDFGTVGSDLVTKTITLRNIGNCSLTIFEANLTGTKDSPFLCDGCSEKDYPIEIFPMREKTITITFTAPKVGSFTDKLELLSDDVEFPTLPVPIRAQFDGIPKLQASPDPVKFGYVEQGKEDTRVVQLVNRGTGIAPVTITNIRLEPADTDAFSIEGSVEHPLPTVEEPFTLTPVKADPRAAYLATVHYHPRSVQAHVADLIVETSSQAVGTLRIGLSGTSETPPALSVSPEIVDFGDVPLGQMMAQTITLVNQGGSPLDLTYSFRNNCPPTNPKCSTDFSFAPATLPSIEPGKFFELQVFVTPAAAGDLQGLLLIGSNDPRRPTSTIPISAKGVNEAGTQVVKVEVSYENGSETMFDNDIRRLDVSLENPYGFMCNRAEPKPTTWGDFGNPQWMALGAKLNPQRVLLVNPKSDGTYRVLLQYTEDCSSLPSQLLASILGISVDALIAYLSGGVINIDSGDVSNAIDSACFSHSGTNANVTVWVNGKTIAEKTAAMNKKGEFNYALDLIREDGVFRPK